MTYGSESECAPTTPQRPTLYNYEMRGIAHEWFRSYLNSRKQYTAGGVSSYTLDIHCGVPQGSVLGPLLLLIYANDIANVIPGESVELFADDTNHLYIYRQENPQETASVTSDCINSLYKWFMANILYYTF